MEICIECKLNWILCHYGGFIYSSVCPEDWQDFSDANILKAERERQSSVELRTLIDGILQQTSNDMRKQCSDVNVAFNKRISETKDTKSKLEDHLNKVSYLLKYVAISISIGHNIPNGWSDSILQSDRSQSYSKQLYFNIVILSKYSISVDDIW